MNRWEKHRLDESEVGCFYDILCQYEIEENHKGYNISKIDKDLKKKIYLDNKSKTIVKPSSRNTVLYRGKNKTADFLRHIRNAFAHCNIISTDKEFLFIDEYHGLLTMNGRMDKSIFFKLIKEINKTKQVE